MAELTLVACPTCGLPAELVDPYRSELGGNGTHARIRCVLLHLSSVPVGGTHGFSTPPRPSRHRLPAGHSATVVQFPTPSRRLFPWREWTHHLVAFFFGALVALLAIRVPIMALPLVPLSLPIFSFAAARRAWKPIFPNVEPVTLRIPDVQVDEPGAAAA